MYVLTRHARKCFQERSFRVRGRICGVAGGHFVNLSPQVLHLLFQRNGFVEEAAKPFLYVRAVCSTGHAII